MKPPSTLTLTVITLFAWLGATIWGPPEWYPRPIPATALDGTVLWSPDGHVIMQHTLAQYNREMIPFEIFFTVLLVCCIWLLSRFCKYLYERRKYGAETQEALSSTEASADRM
ncbi:MAG TPA: hypothetical protein VKV04_22030 [Verrucomicrobiae bacterium]|nr:hypothetical protein [Verrucomicrobiae bacterium]